MDGDETRGESVTRPDDEWHILWIEERTDIRYPPGSRPPAADSPQLDIDIPFPDVDEIIDAEDERG